MAASEVDRPTVQSFLNIDDDRYPFPGQGADQAHATRDEKSDHEEEFAT